jgi:transposase
VSNYLKVEQREQVRALLGLGWTDRRIARETGVHRETVGKQRRELASKPAQVFAGSAAAVEPEHAASDEAEASKPAKVFAGSGAARSTAAPFQDAITEKLEQRLSAQRIWQDLVADYGYTGSYESVKRFVRKLAPERRVVGVMHSAPGEEAQVDFFQGPPTLDAQTGQWRRPWVFRMTLCHSRHGYEEAVWDQKQETFLRLHERAFHALNGVPKILRHDNLKPAVVRACLYDPDYNAVYLAFAAHWGFTALATTPRHPQENGKQERSGGYVKDNALKGRRFDGLVELNVFLRRWNETVARLRIHGTTRRQVWQHYLETDRLALQPVAHEPFALFRCGTRTVHTDAHVEVEGAFYPTPPTLLGETVRVQWDARLVRIVHGDHVVAVHPRVAPGCFAKPPGADPQSLVSSQRAELARLLARCGQVGPELRTWAEAAFAERGVQCLRLLHGVLAQLRRHPREQLLAVARIARERQVFRHKDIVRLLEQRARQQVLPVLLDEHDVIRNPSAYALEELL